MVGAVGAALSAFLLALALGLEADRTVSRFVFLGAVPTIGFLTVTGNPLRPTGRSLSAWGLVIATWASVGWFLVHAGAHALRWPMVSPLAPGDLIAASALILFAIAAVFMRNQVKPVRRLALAATLAGVVALAAALEGWLARRLTVLDRALLGLAGAALVAPLAWADVAGAALLAGWFVVVRLR